MVELSRFAFGTLYDRLWRSCPLSAKIVLVGFCERAMSNFSLSRLSTMPSSVVIVVLFSLCVSSNVGPRFLPLPDLAHDAKEILQLTTCRSASRPHSTGSDCFRVPMAQAQKRADRQLQAQSLSVLPGLHRTLEDNTRVLAELSDPDTVSTVALASLPSGRAPPRLI